MKREIPILEYNDAWMILCQDGFNGTIIDEASIEVMLRIETIMSRLKVMGDDEARRIWIRAKRKKHHFEWLHIGSYQVKDKDFHYLILSDGKYHLGIIKNRDSIFPDTRKHYPVNLKEPLLAIERHIYAVVNWICEDPENYNSYVNQYLPYDKRDGDILRKELIKIDPSWYRVKDADAKIELMMKIKTLKPSEFDKKTLRNYITVWSAAYRIYEEHNADLHDDKYGQERLEECRTLDDVSLFKRHNSKGREIEGLDLDSEEDFMKWHDENHLFHCFDVAYARIHLGFVGTGDWPKQHAPFHLSMWFSVSGYWDDVMAIAIGLHKKGIVLDYPEIDDILEFLRCDDLIGWRPSPDKYMNRDGVKVQCFLPNIGDISRDAYWKIIRASNWHKEEYVEPIKID